MTMNKCIVFCTYTLHICYKFDSYNQLALSLTLTQLYVNPKLIDEKLEQCRTWYFIQEKCNLPNLICTSTHHHKEINGKHELKLGSCRPSLVSTWKGLVANLKMFKRKFFPKACPNTCPRVPCTVSSIWWTVTLLLRSFG